MSYDSNLIIRIDERITVTHNSTENWSFTEPKGLQFVCFKEAIDPKTFKPFLQLHRAEILGWSFDDLKDLQKVLKSCPGGSFVLLAFMDIYPEDIPKNFALYFTNKLGCKYLHGSYLGQWCVLLQKNKNPDNRTPNGGFDSPRKYIGQGGPTIDWDFNYCNYKTWLYLGESYSPHEALIEINLKILPYLLNK